jgi:hypothetical protein
VRCTPAACNGASGGTGVDATFSNTTMAVPSGATAQYTFNGPGTYVYYCSLHGYAVMHGTITVTAAAPTTTASAAPTPLPPPASPATTASDAAALASTGGSVDGIVIVALALLVLGVAALLAGSRRRAEQ